MSVTGKHEVAAVFMLQPFAFRMDARNLAFGGVISRLPGTLFIQYRLEGDVQRLVWPDSGRRSLRRHELWRQTCFEIFFAVPGELSYWEVNMSPDGSWNVYHFNDYRLGMKEEASVQQPAIGTAKSGDTLSLSCRLDVQQLVSDGTPLDVGVAGIVMGADGTASQWAIDHFQSVADFHDRRGFLLAIPGISEQP